MNLILVVQQNHERVTPEARLFQRVYGARWTQGAYVRHISRGDLAQGFFIIIYTVNQHLWVYKISMKFITLETTECRNSHEIGNKREQRVNFVPY